MRNPVKIAGLGAVAVAGSAALFALTPPTREPSSPAPQAAAATPATAPAPKAAVPAASAAKVFIDGKGNPVTPTQEQLAELQAATKSLPVATAPSISGPTDPNDPSKGYMMTVPRLTYSVARVQGDGTLSSHCLPEDAAEAYLEGTGVTLPQAPSTQQEVVE